MADLAAPVAGAAAFGVVAGMTSPTGWLFGAAAVAATLAARGGEAVALRRRHRRERHHHLERLARIDRRLDVAAAAWGRSLAASYPAGHALPVDRIWERTPGDPDFLVVRIGTGPVPAPIRVERPGGTGSRPDRRLRRLGDRVARERCGEGPVLLALGQDPHVAIVGDAEAATSLALAVCLDLAWFHHPDDLRLRLPPDPAFEPLRRLAHVEAAPSRRGRMSVTADGSISVVHLAPDPVPPETTAVVDVDRRRIVFPAGDRPGRTATPEPLRGDDALRMLARCRPADPGAPELLAPLLDGARLPPGAAAIGHDPAGAPVVVDLREAAEGGSGPHLLVVGATGSGKSELLKTLAAGLVHRRQASAVQLLLVDFKGGSAFRPLARLPQVAGVVSDLERDAQAAHRLGEALTGELVRRKERLAAGADGIPRLIVIVDEFAELLDRHPDVAVALESIGRTGRALGVHLVLAGQRPDPGLLRRLDGHLRLRICLRTFTADDSLDAIGVPDAARLPSSPGHALLAVDGRIRPFRVAAAGSDPAALVTTPAGGETGRARRLLPDPLPEVVPIGLSGVYALDDRPGGGGHRRLDPDRMPSILVSGGPGSGKTGALRAIVLAAGTRPEPTDCLVVGDGRLADVLPLPHVSDVIPSDDRDRIVDGLRGIAEHAVRRTLVVVDGLDHLPPDEELRTVLRALADGGPGRRVHLVASAGRPSAAAGFAFAERIELHLPEPHDRRNTGPGTPGIPPGIPGRGIDADGRLLQFVHVPAPVTAVVAARIGLSRLGAGPAPAPERLPVPVHLDGLPEGSIGVALPGARPWGPPAGQDLVAIGGPGSGRTTLVRAVREAAVRTGEAPPEIVDDADRLDPDRMAALATLARSTDRRPVLATVGPAPLHVAPVRHLLDTGACVLLLDAGVGAPPVRGVHHRRLPPGRAMFVDRAGAVTLVQLALPS